MISVLCWKHVTVAIVHPRITPRPFSTTFCCGGLLRFSLPFATVCLGVAAASSFRAQLCQAQALVGAFSSRWCVSIARSDAAVAVQTYVLQHGTGTKCDIHNSSSSDIGAGWLAQGLGDPKTFFIVLVGLSKNYSDGSAVAVVAVVAVVVLSVVEVVVIVVVVVVVGEEEVVVVVVVAVVLAVVAVVAVVVLSQERNRETTVIKFARGPHPA